MVYKGQRLKQNISRSGRFTDIVKAKQQGLFDQTGECYKQQLRVEVKVLDTQGANWGKFWKCGRVEERLMQVLNEHVEGQKQPLHVQSWHDF